MEILNSKVWVRVNRQSSRGRTQDGMGKLLLSQKIAPLAQNRPTKF